MTPEQLNQWLKDLEGGYGRPGALYWLMDSYLSVLKELETLRREAKRWKEAATAFEEGLYHDRVSYGALEAKLDKLLAAAKGVTEHVDVSFERLEAAINNAEQNQQSQRLKKGGDHV